MLAVIKTGGKQYLVSPGDKIKIEKLEMKPGKDFIFKEILCVFDGKEAKFGTPLLSGATVKAKVLSEGKSKKKIVFKYKAKKRYRVKKGHRQPYIEVEIGEILGGGSPRKMTAKKPVAKKVVKKK